MHLEGCENHVRHYVIFTRKPKKKKTLKKPLTIRGQRDEEFAGKR